MTRTLVVDRDAASLEREADALYLCGYDVARCHGPLFGSCPVLVGLPCPLAERADVLVYDIADARIDLGDGSLFSELRELYADRPIVLTARDGDPQLDEVQNLGRGVVRLSGEPSPIRLSLAVEEALADR